LLRVRPDGRAGFTLIEVLVALAVVAASIAAIGSLVGVAAHGTLAIERRVAFRETLRSIVTSLSDRQTIAAGSATGSIAGYDWRMDAAPYVSNLVDPRAPSPWQPQDVVITVRSPSGQILRVETIRLRRRSS